MNYESSGRLDSTSKPAVCASPARCTTSSTPRRSPAPASSPPPSGRASARWSASSRRATRRCWSAATRCSSRSTPGTAPIAAKPIDQRRLSRSSCASIGYLQPEPRGLRHRHRRMSMPRSPRIAGPQLVVPVTNARYALNAANARWGSLYDALYGTDAIPEDGGATRGGGYNKMRGARVIARARDIPGPGGAARRRQPRRCDGYARRTARRCRSRCRTAARPRLRDPAQFVGYRGDAAGPSAVLLRHHGLHIEIVIDRTPPDRPGRSGRRRRCAAGSGDHHHPGLRGFDRRGRCRGQGAGLSQLARPDEGHAGGHVREGRPAR